MNNLPNYESLLRILISKILKLPSKKIKKKYYVNTEDIFKMLEDFGEIWEIEKNGKS